MAEESKLTLKIGVIASFIAAIVIFVLQSLWMHQTDIAILKTNQVSIIRTIEKLDKVPADLARMEVLLRNNRENQLEIMKRLNR